MALRTTAVIVLWTLWYENLVSTQHDYTYLLPCLLLSTHSAAQWWWPGSHEVHV